MPDTVEALKKLPQLFQTAVREASEGRLRLTVEHPGMLELRRELAGFGHAPRHRARRGRALAVRTCLAHPAAQHYRWLGGLQMAAAIVSLAWYRSLRRQANENSHRELDQLSGPQRAPELARLDRVRCPRPCGGSRRRRVLARPLARGRRVVRLARETRVDRAEPLVRIRMDDLYVLMGCAVWLVSRERYHARRAPAFAAYAVQLLLNALWAPLFFGERNLGAGLFDQRRLVARDALDPARILRGAPACGVASVPYFGLGRAIAMALNFSLWRLNP